MTRMISVDPLHPTSDSLQDAVDLLQKGEVVAFPTETVYGLGADATNPHAVAKIYAAKKRPADNPLIIHFATIEAITPYLAEIPQIFHSLAEKFWPGPLTLVLKQTQNIASNASQGLDTIAVRIPAHAVALALIQESGVPIAAPSANLSGKPSPTRAEHVISDFKDQIPMIVSGGPTLIGVESTVVNLTTSPPTLLRPGGVTVEDLLELIPDLVIPESYSAQHPVSPGMKYTHYSPETELILLRNSRQLSSTAIDEIASINGRNPLILCTSSSHSHTTDVLSLGDSLFEIQVNLFSALRLLDEKSYDVGLFEDVILEKEGFTIMNRIEKAAHHVITTD